jgi:uncharacterized protein YbaP (TraB family)
VIRHLLAGTTLLALGMAALAEIPPEDLPQEAVEIEEVLVTGEQPGPGLWKVTHPGTGNAHVLWILGTYGPLPKKMRWRSTELEETLAASQEVIAPPSMRADVGGPLGGITLLPSLVGLRKNPNGERLQEVLPPDLYARWLPLKQRYLGGDDDAEKLARKARVKITTPEVRVKVEKPRAAIKDFKQAPLSDIECFEKTIERLETDLELMRVRANAWATGDVARLRELAPVDNASACISVVMNAQLMQDRGYTDWPGQLAEAWIEAAESALGQNASTVAVLSTAQILRPDGYVARLRAKGYLVEDP